MNKRNVQFCNSQPNSLTDQLITKKSSEYIGETSDFQLMRKRSSEIPFLNAKNPLVLLKSKSIKKRQNFNHLKANNAITTINKKNILIQKPFPLLKLISNKLTPNNTKFLVESLMYDHNEYRNSQNLAQPSSLNNMNINTNSFLGKNRLNTRLTNRISGDQLKIINNSTPVLITESNFFMTNSDNFESVKNISQTCRISFKTTSSNTSGIPNLSPSSENGLRDFQKSRNIKFKIKVNPEDNYARFAYKFKKIYEEQSMFNQIQNHLEKIDKKGSIMQKILLSRNKYSLNQITTTKQPRIKISRYNTSEPFYINSKTELTN